MGGIPHGQEKRHPSAGLEGHGLDLGAGCVGLLVGISHLGDQGVVHIEPVGGIDLRQLQGIDALGLRQQQGEYIAAAAVGIVAGGGFKVGFFSDGAIGHVPVVALLLELGGGKEHVGIKCPAVDEVVNLIFGEICLAEYQKPVNALRPRRGILVVLVVEHQAQCTAQRHSKKHGEKAGGEMLHLRRLLPKNHAARPAATSTAAPASTGSSQVRLVCCASGSD